jgi:hypothetical protein
MAGYTAAKGIAPGPKIQKMGGAVGPKKRAKARGESQNWRHFEIG